MRVFQCRHKLYALSLLICVATSIYFLIPRRSGDVTHPTPSLLQICNSNKSFKNLCKCLSPQELLALPVDSFHSAFALVLESASQVEETMASVRTLLLAGVSDRDLFIFQRLAFVPDPTLNTVELPGHSSFEDYKFVLDILFNCHPSHYSHLVVIDGHMALSSDIVLLHQQLAAMTQDDPHLFAISFASVHGYESTAVDPRQFRRTDAFVAGAWAITRRVYHRVLLHNVDLSPPRPDAIPNLFPTHPVHGAVPLQVDGAPADLDALAGSTGPWHLVFDAVMAGHQLDVLYPEVARAALRWHSLDPPPAHLLPILNIKLHSGSPVKPATLSGTDMSLERYVQSLREHVQSAMLAPCVEAIGVTVRDSHVVVAVDAVSDSDAAWDAVLGDRMGLVARAAGAWCPHGVFRGTVLLRFRRALVLLVARYSPFAQLSPVAEALAEPPACSGPSHAQRRRVVASTGGAVVLGRVGISCTTACAPRRCDASMLHLGNDCEHGPPCRSCVPADNAPWAPARRLDGAGSTVRDPAACVRAAKDRLLSCDALAPVDVVRVCVCLPTL